MKRGDIYLVSYDPIIGSEIGKTRPSLVVQNNSGNTHSKVLIFVAITSHFKSNLPTLVHLTDEKFGLDKPSTINCSQIRSLDKSRLVHKIGTVDEVTMRQVDEALKISLGLLDLED